MSEIGAGIRPTRSAEIVPNVSVVERLKDAEKKGSRQKFKKTMESWPEVKGADSIKRASKMAVDQVSKLLKGQDVVNEMVKLGVKVDIGRFSVSARPEDDEAKINSWKALTGRGNPSPVITVKVGPEEFSVRGVFEEFTYPRELERMLNKPEGRNEIWAAVEELSNLTPRDIARAFRKSIEDGQSAVKKGQKQGVKQELRELRRGH